MKRDISEIITSAQSALKEVSNPDLFMEHVERYMDQLDQIIGADGALNELEEEQLTRLNELHGTISSSVSKLLGETGDAITGLQSKGKRVLSYIDNFPRVISSLGKRKG